MTVFAWGNDEHAQTGLGKTGPGVRVPTPAVVVNEVAGVSSIHGQFFSVLLHMQDGSSMGFGGKGDCQLVDGKGGVEEQAPVPVPAKTLYKPALQISARGAHSLALLEDRTIEAGGGNSSATRGDGTQEPLKDIAHDPFPSRVRLPADAAGLVAAVAAGDAGCSALLSDGRVLSWGITACGDGARETRLVPVYTEVGGVKAIARGWSHGLALLEDGTVVAWGSNNRHQCGRPTGTYFVTPIPVELPEKIVAIAAAGALSLALGESGTLYEWGYLLSTVAGAKPRPVLGGVTAFDAGCYQTTASVLAIAGGTVHGWGPNDLWQVGDGTHVPKASPVDLGLKASAVSCGAVNSYALA